MITNRMKKIKKAIDRMPSQREIPPDIQTTIDRVRAKVNSEEYQRPKPPTPEEIEESRKRIEALKESIMRGMK